MLAEPADLPSRDASHQCVGFDVAIDDGAGGDERVRADSGTADDRAVGADRRTALHESIAILVLSIDRGARVVHVGEYHARAAEDVIFKGDVVVDRYIILNLDVVADDDLVADKNVLTQRAAVANADSRGDVPPVPDACVVADLCAFVDDRRGMCGVVGHGFLNH